MRNEQGAGYDSDGHRREQHYWCITKRRSRGINRFRHFLGFAEKGAERAQSANRRHHQDRCPQGCEIYPWGRLEENRQQEVSKRKFGFHERQGVGPAVFAFLFLLNRDGPPAATIAST